MDTGVFRINEVWLYISFMSLLSDMLSMSSDPIHRDRVSLSPQINLKSCNFSKFSVPHTLWKYVNQLNFKVRNLYLLPVERKIDEKPIYVFN